MSADLLRRAAAKLRQHTEAAKPGPWEVDHEDLFFILRTRKPMTYLYEADIVEVHSPDDTWADFDYFALMHPPVALALADLLDIEAGIAEETEAIGMRLSRSADAVLALARVVLREPEETP